jgi:hypothetical protein
MQSIDTVSGSSRKALWTGRVISTICVLFLILDGVTKVIQDPHVLQALAQGGYQPGVAVPLGITVLLCTLLNPFPKLPYWEQSCSPVGWAAQSIPWFA